MTNSNHRDALHRVRRRQFKKMILARTAALPAMVTLLNGISGVLSIHYATLDKLGEATPFNLMVAAWLIFAAMLFDALDGRLARMTRQTTDFGAQLDSLCDAISFGVAPAILMVRTVALTQEITNFEIFTVHSGLGKIVFAIALVYVACAILRLARFNIENAPDLLHHQSFKGLPSPGAAAAVAAMVLLFDRLRTDPFVGWLNLAVAIAVPLLTLTVALLMVSRFRYPHVMNQFARGKKTFNYLLVAVVLVIAGIANLQLTMALVPIIFALSGPVIWLVRRFRPAHHAQPPQAPPPPAPTT